MQSCNDYIPIYTVRWRIQFVGKTGAACTVDGCVTSSLTRGRARLTRVAEENAIPCLRLDKRNIKIKLCFLFGQSELIAGA